MPLPEFNPQKLDHLHDPEKEYHFTFPVYSDPHTPTEYTAEIRISGTEEETEESVVSIRILDRNNQEIIPWSWPERFHDLLDTPFLFTLDHHSYVVPFD